MEWIEMDEQSSKPSWQCQDDVFRVFGGDKIETLMDLKTRGMVLRWQS